MSGPRTTWGRLPHTTHCNTNTCPLSASPAARTDSSITTRLMVTTSPGSLVLEEAIGPGGYFLAPMPPSQAECPESWGRSCRYSFPYPVPLFTLEHSEHWLCASPCPGPCSMVFLSALSTDWNRTLSILAGDLCLPTTPHFSVQAFALDLLC